MSASRGGGAMDGGVADLGDSRQKNGGRKMRLKFTNSTAALLEGHTPSTTRRFMASRASAALQLHRTRLQGMSHRLALCFLLGLALVLAWIIGYFHASPALLVLLGVASVAIGIGRWQQVVDGAELEAELRARQKSRSQVLGETVEWLNVALHNWWNTCSDSVLFFMKDHVESLVKDILPSSIDQLEVVGVDLGGQTPSLSNVKLCEAPPTLGVVSDAGTSTAMVVLFDVTIPAPDAQIVLRAKVGGKSLSSSHLAYIESLYVNGTIQAILVFDNQLPFPHLSKITATFVSKPDIWFSVRVLKGLRVMEIPLLKNWVHSLVMDTFTTLLVDPGKLTFNFDRFQEHGRDSKTANATHNKAVGVVTVKVKGQPPSGSSLKDLSQGRCVTLRLGKKKYKWPLEMGAWQATYAFLVHDLNQEVLVLKVKQRRLMYGTTLAHHSTSLASLGLLVTDTGEAVSEDRVVTYGSSECQFCLNISYTVLPTISLQTTKPPAPLLPHQRSGVLYIHVHEGTGLQAADSNGLSDPYCVVMANKQKILRTDYVAGTLFPTWDTAVEVLVADLEQVVLAFVVFDYDGPVVGDDFLGVAKLPLSLATPALLHHSLPLRKMGAGISSSDESLGSITVSVMFRPVASVGEASPACHVTNVPAGSHEAAMVESDSCFRRKSSNWAGRRKSKKRGKQRIPVLKESDEDGYNVRPVMEVEVVKGRDLVPKDSNGLSDPYVVIKYGSHVMFRSSVIKKTLNPHWEESATLTAPGTDDVIHVECWDKDVFSDDYMGSMTFSYSDITTTFTGKPCWCKLQHVKHGELLLYLSLPHERGRSQEEEPSEAVRWSHLDEASRQLVGEVELRENPAMGGGIIMRNGSGLDEREDDEELCSNSSSSVQSNSVRGSSSEAAVSHTSSNTGVASNASGGPFSPGRTSISSVELANPPVLKRRHTLAHHRTSAPSEIFKKYEESTDPSQLPRYPETTADIKWALMQGGGEEGGDGGGRTVAGMDRTQYKEKLHTVYHDLSGQVIEASGLKGNLDHMELYVKLRLNTRPSYQRQHKFARGPVVHKTRNLRGSNNPQWMEDFVVKESPVPSDSLLTLDLKSGSKVNIGTYAITLDKFFEGQMKSTHTFNIGNDMKLKVKMSRQLPVGK